MHDTVFWGLAEATGNGWQQLVELAMALILSSLIGLERAVRRRDAGLRTYALVGVGSALFLLVSEYGFQEVTRANLVILDPSRVAAQIVTGIGFLGGALIFKDRGFIRGLTTAAAVWVAAAVGMACAAGLPVLAVATTAAYFLVVFGYTWLRRTLHLAAGPASLSIAYRDGRGILRQILAECTGHGFTVGELSSEEIDPDQVDGDRAVRVVLELRGRGAVTELAGDLQELDGVLKVGTEAD
ncbi:MAG TPA: MgtC/SapB family protein [Candidatus Dormibacteraeota bacterium]|jgi:putative Mg2+ transporter-C (MgtC) family protein|nr:MgtC/SapB family protein [Candidatus Dormibacteraeota bacterium]